jgi:hypothetical protein
VILVYGLRRSVFRDFGDFTKVPLDRNPYLRDVAEPITLIRGPREWASDQTWIGIVFVDAKHVERWAEYITTSYAPVELHQTLVIGGKAVPVGGPEERAFLGLLQRWQRQDAEARGLTGYPKDVDFSALTERQQARINGVLMIKRLLERNGLP